VHRFLSRRVIEQVFRAVATSFKFEATEPPFRHRGSTSTLGRRKNHETSRQYLEPCGADDFFHKYRIKEKLGLNTDADLVRFAIKNHITVR